MKPELKWKVHVTRPLPEIAQRLLKEGGCQVSIPREEGLPEKAKLVSAVGECDGILSILTENIDSSIMDRSPKLKVISNMAVGFDNIDLEAANERKIAVCNTPGVLTETSADFAWALLMAVARRVVECHRYVEEGHFRWWGPRLMLGSDVHHKTLGIIGFGKIGQALARRAQGFSMRVLYCGDSASPESLLGMKVSQAELLRESDFVSLHVPYRTSTHHLLGKEEFQLMKETAFLVNTSRGAVVNESALVDALVSGNIAGAGLDVFEEEPKVHPGLIGLDKVVLAPHAASASVDTREKMAAMAAKNLLDCLEGKRPQHIVNPEVLG